MSLLLAGFAFAAPWDVVRDELRGEHLALDGTIRTLARWETEPDGGDRQGLRWQAVRARLSGATGPLRFVLHAEAAPRPRLLDAWVSVQPVRAIRLTVGHHRPPVSREMLTPLEHVLFSERAVPVQRLAPAWDWGATLSGRVGRFRWDVGVFESGWLHHDGALPLLAARIGADTRLGPGVLTLDLAGAASQDVDEPWAGASFTGRRALGSASATWVSRPVTFGTEILSSVLLPEVARDDYPVGGHATVQVRPTRFGSLEGRVEAYSRTFTPGLLWEARLGGTLTPIEPVKAMLHYRFPLHRKRLGDHAVELALQLTL